MSEGRLVLSGSALDLVTLAGFDHRRPRVELAAEARRRMKASVRTVEKVAQAGKPCYGINTGFGALANRQIPSEQVENLQYNLVRSHACGIGDPLPDSTVRLILLLKANSLAPGASGIRPEVVDTLLRLLNNDVLPVIPAKGSVGASGDLAPLAHLALALIGEGSARHRGESLEGRAVTEAAGCQPVKLQAKEGLALLNGTQVSTALAIEALFRANVLLQSSIVIGSLTIEGLAGSHVPFDERIQTARRQNGQSIVAEKFRRLLTDSEIKRSHEECDRVQDPYSARCMPQVLGAVWDTLRFAADILSREINSVSDNPLIFGHDVLSGGNFHAAPVGFVSDFLGIAITELASMSERRADLLERGVNPNLNLFLATEPGLESGFMIAQVVAAALASENKTLAHPASVDTVPTSAGQEDHVSMATWAGLKLGQICDNAAQILAIELLVAAQAIDEQRPLHTTPILEELHAFVRTLVPCRSRDERLDNDIGRLAEVIEAGKLLDYLGEETLQPYG